MCGWSIVWISRMKLRATPNPDARKDVDQDHAEQGAERRPEFE
jgi:hypothetical protein